MRMKYNCSSMFCPGFVLNLKLEILAAFIVLGFNVINGQKQEISPVIVDTLFFPSSEGDYIFSANTKNDNVTKSTEFQDVNCQDVYFVNQGDTLSQISAKFGVTIKDIQEVNPDIDNPNLIFVGQSINIPPCEVAEKNSGDVYYVKAEDTLSKIARQFGLSIQEILSVNPEITNPELIFVGQAINIPSSGGGLGPNPGPNKQELKEFSKDSFLECGKFVDTFDALLQAMETLEVVFETDEEAAMFMAQILHEGTTNPTRTREFCWVEDPPCGGAYDGPCKWNPSILPAQGQHYFGRGPIQLTWVCNYKVAGDALGLDLVNNPDQIVQDDVIAWKTALWYWFFSYNKPTKAAQEFDFAGTTKAINPPECGKQDRQRQRVQYYKQISACMGLQTSSKLFC